MILNVDMLMLHPLVKVKNKQHSCWLWIATNMQRRDTQLEIESLRTREAEVCRIPWTLEIAERWQSKCQA